MSKSLREILDVFHSVVEDDLAPEDFKPEELVGDLRGKIDGIKFKCDEWEAKAAAVEHWIGELKAKQSALLGKAKSLMNYAKAEMLKHKYEELPGEMFRLRVQNSNPSVEVGLEASPELFLAYPDFVKQDTAYNWDKKAIKQAIDLGKDVPFATLKTGKQIRFYAK